MPTQIAETSDIILYIIILHHAHANSRDIIYIIYNIADISYIYENALLFAPLMRISLPGTCPSKPNG